jgi:ubiquinone/menaquinone biosynthesis C-methylase UbiE
VARPPSIRESANLAADAFAGTAEAYLKYRPPYPAELLADLLARADLPAQPRLVDLASGPGRVALALAPAFAAVDAVDLEPEMVEVGAREAARLGLGNVRWTVGRAEAFEAPDAAVDLVTVGDAFHRLDQRRVLRQARRWLKPGGAFVTLGSDSLFSGRVAWQEAVTQLARNWTRKAFPEGWAAGRAGAALDPDSRAAQLREAGFEPPVEATFAATYEWTFERVLGFLESTSVCSRRRLGEDYERFKQALADELAKFGVTREEQRLQFSYTLARRAA